MTETNPPLPDEVQENATPDQGVTPMSTTQRSKKVPARKEPVRLKQVLGGGYQFVGGSKDRWIMADSDDFVEVSE